MASVYRRTRKRKLKDGTVRARKVWAIEWRELSGKIRSLDTDYDTKAQARSAARVIEERLENERRGVVVGLDETADQTLGELLRWWLSKVDARSPSHKSNLTTLEKNLLGSARAVPGKPHYKAHKLASVRLRDLTTGQINLWLDERELEGELGEGTVNHLRMFIIRAWTDAHALDRLTKHLLCPALEAERRKVPKRLPNFLYPEEVPPMLRWVAEQWRDLFATAVYTGMRKGELGGMLKTEVDFRQMGIRAGHSYERDRTKAGNEDPVPIHPELVPYLEHAIAESDGPNVFQVLRPIAKKHGGGVVRHAMTRDTKLDRILKSALRRAGIVTGYLHKCRRRGCGYVSEALSDDGSRWCPAARAGHVDPCGFKLQAVGIPKKVRFHDLRHTTASLYLMAGVDMDSISRILRHADPRVTREIYAHLVPGWMQNRIRLLSLTGPREVTLDPAPGTAPVAGAPKASTDERPKT